MLATAEQLTTDLVEQCFGIIQVGGIEALGEPMVNIKAACQLLDTARIPITEIAASLGYAETSAFGEHKNRLDTSANFARIFANSRLIAPVR
jgi:hypothetical protein